MTDVVYESKTITSNVSFNRYDGRFNSSIQKLTIDRFRKQRETEGRKNKTTEQLT